LEKLGEKLGQVLKDIYIPDDILSQLEKSLVSDNGRQESLQRQQRERLEQRLGSVRQRFDRAYTDKLDGKISEEFWERKVAEWQAEEEQIQIEIQNLEQVKPERILDAVKILELANKAYFLYLKQTPSEKAELLRLVLSNCAIDAVSVYPTYRRPFDLMFQRAKNEEWRARGDSNSRPSGS
jgi:site-specific DNA recombinase